MEIQNKKKKSILFLVPLAGMALFVLFYILAALNYPGGSRVHPYETGFSFWNNYLCDLLDVHTIGGVLNPARHYSRIALLILCSSLILLWYYLPELFDGKKSKYTLVRSLGMVSLMITLFMTGGNHDIVVRVAGVFGGIALILMIYQLQRAGYHELCGLGIFCVLIFLVNYYVYETGIYIDALPVIQKFTFFSFLCWFVLLDIALYRQTKTKKEIR